MDVFDFYGWENGDRYDDPIDVDDDDMQMIHDDAWVADDDGSDSSSSSSGMDYILV